MTKSARPYLEHALLCIGRIRDYTADGSEASFLTDHKTQDAVIRNLEVIGQCIKDHGTESLQLTAPNIKWRTIAAFRNVLAHEYLGVKPSLVWNIVANDLIPLEDALKDVLAE